MVHPKRSVFGSNQVQGVSEEPQPSRIDPDCQTLFLREKSVQKGAQIGRSRTLFWATSSKSKTCISELRQDFSDRSVSNHISQPSSGNLAAQNALRRLVERERKGSHTLPPPQEDSQLSILIYYTTNNRDFEWVLLALPVCLGILGKVRHPWYW